HHPALVAHRPRAGEQQYELIGHDDPFRIEPCAAFRDVGHETITGQRACRLDFGHAVDAVALVAAALFHCLSNCWGRSGSTSLTGTGSEIVSCKAVLEPAAAGAPPSRALGSARGSTDSRPPSA